MKAYVQFLDVDLKGQTVDALGSDGVHQLDARNSLGIMIEDAWARMKALKNVKPYYIGFEIRRGNLKRSTTLYRIVAGGKDIIDEKTN